jgi:hypothetical protein
MLTTPDLTPPASKPVLPFNLARVRRRARRVLRSLRATMAKGV